VYFLKFWLTEIYVFSIGFVALAILIVLFFLLLPIATVQIVWDYVTK